MSRSPVLRADQQGMMMDVRTIVLAASTAAALALAGSATAADLTIDYGSTAAPYSASGLFQVIEDGNPFGDTPRTTVIDLGGTLAGSGSSAPITTASYMIDLDFTTLGASTFTAGDFLLIGGTTGMIELFHGATSLGSASGVAGVPFNLAPININAGTYTLRLTGDLSNSEAEGQFSFSGLPASSGAPEPAAWAVMIMGFGLAGSVLRRRVITTA